MPSRRACESPNIADLARFIDEIIDGRGLHVSDRQNEGSSTGEDDPFEVLRLENQLCFALYAATRAITRAYREKLDAMNLTYPQYLVLITLWENDHLTISQIGDLLILDSGTLTPLVKRLETMGLVERQRDDVDQRQVHVNLTSKGERMKREALKAREFVACRLGMSENEIKLLRADLMELIHTLGD